MYLKHRMFSKQKYNIIFFTYDIHKFHSKILKSPFWWQNIISSGHFLRCLKVYLLYCKTCIVAHLNHLVGKRYFNFFFWELMSAIRYRRRYKNYFHQSFTVLVKIFLKSYHSLNSDRDYHNYERFSVFEGLERPYFKGLSSRNPKN